MLLRSPGIVGAPGTGRRPALSLLEVLVALAIFLVSLAALAYLLTLSGNMAMEAQQRTHAMHLAQSKLAEVIAGAMPIQSGSGSFDEDPDYQWSVDSQQGATQNLWNVTVKVTRPRKKGKPLEVTLCQMVLDPSNVGSTQDVTPAVTASTSTQNGTDSSSGSGASSGSGSSGGAPAAKPASTPAPAPAPATTPAKSPGSGKGTASTGRSS
jgi:type II secretion system protein I